MQPEGAYNQEAGHAGRLDLSFHIPNAEQLLTLCSEKELVVQVLTAHIINTQATTTRNFHAVPRLA